MENLDNWKTNPQQVQQRLKNIHVFWIEMTSEAHNSADLHLWPRPRP